MTRNVHGADYSFAINREMFLQLTGFVLRSVLYKLQFELAEDQSAKVTYEYHSFVSCPSIGRKRVGYQNTRPKSQSCVRRSEAYFLHNLRASHSTVLAVWRKQTVHFVELSQLCLYVKCGIRNMWRTILWSRFNEEGNQRNQQPVAFPTCSYHHQC